MRDFLYWTWPVLLTYFDGLRGKTLMWSSIWKLQLFLPVLNTVSLVSRWVKSVDGRTDEWLDGCDFPVTPEFDVPLYKLSTICIAWVALMLSASCNGLDVNLGHIVPVINSKYYLSNENSFENRIITQKSAFLIYFAAETWSLDLSFGWWFFVLVSVLVEMAIVSIKSLRLSYPAVPFITETTEFLVAEL